MKRSSCRQQNGRAGGQVGTDAPVLAKDLTGTRSLSAFVTSSAGRLSCCRDAAPLHHAEQGLQRSSL